MAAWSAGGAFVLILDRRGCNLRLRRAFRGAKRFLFGAEASFLGGLLLELAILVGPAALVFALR